MQDGLRAYADESVYATGDHRMYLVCATVFGGGADTQLDAFASVKPKGAAKLHWRDMPVRLQTSSLEALASVAHSSTVIVGAPLDGVRQERGRRLCLQTLIPILEGRGINLLAMESRNPTLDQRDVELLDALRKRGHAGPIRLEHVRGEADVRLWVPDQILGAYGDEIVGRPKTQRWSDAWESVRESVERVDIPLR